MIQLAGYTVRDDKNPDGDIEIRFTGLRPAEKLFEELLIGKNVTGTEHPRILRAMEHSLTWEQMRHVLDDLAQCSIALRLRTGARDPAARRPRIPAHRQGPGPCLAARRLARQRCRAGRRREGARAAAPAAGLTRPLTSCIPIAARGTLVRRSSLEFRPLRPFGRVQGIHASHHFRLRLRRPGHRRLPCGRRQRRAVRRRRRQEDRRPQAGRSSRSTSPASMRSSRATSRPGA